MPPKSNSNRKIEEGMKDKPAPAKEAPEEKKA